MSTGPEVFFRTECGMCGNEFTTSDEEADLCGLCEADEQLQRDMDSDRG